MSGPDLHVTREQFVQLKALAFELSGDCWSEAKWLDGAKRILGRDDIEAEHQYAPTWAGVTIKVIDRSSERDRT